VEPHVFAEPPRPVRDEPRDRGDARWMSARGVTNDSARDAELGAGKWTESARPLEELARELPRSPTRSMEIPEGGGNGAWVALAVLFVVLFAGAFFAFRGTDDAPPAPAERVAFHTSPEGAEVVIDGRTVGVAPVEIALPDEGVTIVACALWAGTRHCTKLDRSLLQNGYTFERPSL
jgi:hypothetical protein